MYYRVTEAYGRNSYVIDSLMNEFFQVPTVLLVMQTFGTGLQNNANKYFFNNNYSAEFVTAKSVCIR